MSQVVNEPPLRLPLGRDAVTYAEGGAQARAAADAAWRELSPSTDHEQVTAAPLDALGRSASMKTPDRGE
jgi:hypothetical protein